MNWRQVSKCDPIAKAIAERHYTVIRIKSRPMGKEIGPPGQKIVLLTLNNEAIWGSHRPAPWAGIKRSDGFEGATCFIYRKEKECAVPSSLLIREACAYTVSHWGLSEFLTYVGIEHIESQNPGYCFIQAGFIPQPGYTYSSKIGWLRKLIMPLTEISNCLLESGLPLLNDCNHKKE